MDPATSIQRRLFPAGTCFGCGPQNPNGLRLESFPGDGVVVATFQPWPEHDNGLGFLNGGIIATVLDCHSGAAAFHEADLRGWPPEPGASFAFVTAGLDLRYLRPAPLHEPVELRAYARDPSAEQMTVTAELWWDGKQRSAATSVWKRWRPRR